MKLWGVVMVLALIGCKDKAPSAKSPEPAQAVPATCKQDSDCVISCEQRDGCCAAHCCETAMLASEDQAIEAYNRTHCPKDPQCPTVGGCPMDNIVTARCQDGACVADKKPRTP